MAPKNCVCDVTTLSRVVLLVHFIRFYERPIPGDRHRQTTNLLFYYNIMYLILIPNTVATSWVKVILKVLTVCTEKYSHSEPHNLSEE